MINQSLKTLDNVCLAVTGEAPGDGDCLFHSLAALQWPTRQRGPKAAAAMRAVLCDQIEINSGEFEAFFPKGGFEQHVNVMRQQGTWGGDVELTAFIKHFQRDVIVAQVAADGRLTRIVSYSDTGPLATAADKDHPFVLPVEHRERAVYLRHKAYEKEQEPIHFDPLSVISDTTFGSPSASNGASMAAVSPDSTSPPRKFQRRWEEQEPAIETVFSEMGFSEVSDECDDAAFGRSGSVYTESEENKGIDYTSGWSPIATLDWKDWNDQIRDVPQQRTFQNAAHYQFLLTRWCIMEELVEDDIYAARNAALLENFCGAVKFKFLPLDKHADIVSDRVKNATREFLLTWSEGLLGNGTKKVLEKSTAFEWLCDSGFAARHLFAPARFGDASRLEDSIVKELALAGRFGNVRIRDKADSETIVVLPPNVPLVPLDTNVEMVHAQPDDFLSSCEKANAAILKLKAEVTNGDLQRACLCFLELNEAHVGALATFTCILETILVERSDALASYPLFVVRELFLRDVTGVVSAQFIVAQDIHAKAQCWPSFKKALRELLPDGIPGLQIVMTRPPLCLGELDSDSSDEEDEESSCGENEDVGEESNFAQALDKAGFVLSPTGRGPFPAENAPYDKSRRYKRALLLQDGPLLFPHRDAGVRVDNADLTIAVPTRALGLHSGIDTITALNKIMTGVPKRTGALIPAFGFMLAEVNAVPFMDPLAILTAERRRVYVTGLGQRDGRRYVVNHERVILQTAVSMVGALGMNHFTHCLLFRSDLEFFDSQEGEVRIDPMERDFASPTDRIQCAIIMNHLQSETPDHELHALLVGGSSTLYSGRGDAVPTFARLIKTWKAELLEFVGQFHLKSRSRALEFVFKPGEPESFGVRYLEAMLATVPVPEILTSKHLVQHMDVYRRQNIDANSGAYLSKGLLNDGSMFTVYKLHQRAEVLKHERLVLEGAYDFINEFAKHMDAEPVVTLMAGELSNLVRSLRLEDSVPRCTQMAGTNDKPVLHVRIAVMRCSSVAVYNMKEGGRQVPMASQLVALHAPSAITPMTAPPISSQSQPSSAPYDGFLYAIMSRGDFEVDELFEGGVDSVETATDSRPTTAWVVAGSDPRGTVIASFSVGEDKRSGGEVFRETLECAVMECAKSAATRRFKNFNPERMDVFSEYDVRVMCVYSRPSRLQHEQINAMRDNQHVVAVSCPAFSQLHSYYPNAFYTANETGNETGAEWFGIRVSDDAGFHILETIVMATSVSQLEQILSARPENAPALRRKLCKHVLDFVDRHYDSEEDANLADTQRAQIPPPQIPPPRQVIAVVRSSVATSGDVAKGQYSDSIQSQMTTIQDFVKDIQRDARVQPESKFGPLFIASGYKRYDPYDRMFLAKAGASVHELEINSQGERVGYPRSPADVQCWLVDGTCVFAHLSRWVSLQGYMEHLINRFEQHGTSIYSVDIFKYVKDGALPEDFLIATGELNLRNGRLLHFLKFASTGSMMFAYEQRWAHVYNFSYQGIFEKIKEKLSRTRVLHDPSDDRLEGVIVRAAVRFPSLLKLENKNSAREGATSEIPQFGLLTYTGPAAAALREVEALDAGTVRVQSTPSVKSPEARQQLADTVFEPLATEIAQKIKESKGSNKQLRKVAAGSLVLTEHTTWLVDVYEFVTEKMITDTGLDNEENEIARVQLAKEMARAILPQKCKYHSKGKTLFEMVEAEIKRRA